MSIEFWYQAVSAREAFGGARAVIRRACRAAGVGDPTPLTPGPGPDRRLMPSTRASMTASLDSDEALAHGLAAQRWAGRPPTAVILATSQRVVEGYAADQLVCLTEFEGRSVIEWWAGCLAAWGLTDITIVATQAHRSCFVPPSPGEAADADIGRAVAQHRELTDHLHGPTGVADLGRYVFLGRQVSPDPLAQLLEVLPGIDNELLVVIDGDTLPPPVNPYTLVPTVVDVADQVAEFFHERGLLPVISAARGPVAGRCVHAALPALPQVSLCAKGGRKRPCTAAELVARPCRACLKVNIHWLLTGRWLDPYVRRVRQHLDLSLGDRESR